MDCLIPWTCCIHSFEFIECTISNCSFVTSKEEEDKYLSSITSWTISSWRKFSSINLSCLASLIDKWSQQWSRDVYLNVIVERWETRSKNFVVLSVDVVIIRSSEILYWHVVIVDSWTWGTREIIWPLVASQMVRILSRSVPEHNDLPSWESWQSITICSWTPFHYNDRNKIYKINSMDLFTISLPVSISKQRTVLSQLHEYKLEWRWLII